MAIYTIKPTSDVSNANLTTSGPTVWSILQDGTDTHTITFSANPGPSLAVVELADPVIPASETIVRVRAVARWSTTGSGGTDTYLILENGSGQQATPDYFTAAKGTTPTTDYAGWKTTAPDGGAWTPAKVNALRLRLQDNGYAGGTAPKPVWREAWVEVETSGNPSATWSTPTGTVTDTTQPTFSGTYSDPDGDVLDGYRVKVFSLAQYSAGGFDPETSSATWDSGLVSQNGGTAIAGTIGTPLANGTYRLYGKARNAVLASGHYTAWAYAQFTVSVVPPNTPSLGATADAANNRMALTLQGFDNLLTADESDFEAGLGSWFGPLNCGVTRIASGLATSGGYIAQVSSLAAGRMDAVTASGVNGKPVVGGSAYRVIADVRAATVSRTSVLMVYWFTSAGAAASTAFNTVASSADATGSWTTLAGNVTAPANAAYAQVVVSFQNPAAASEIHYIEKAGIMPGSGTVWARGPVAGTVRTFEVQRSIDGGSTWTDLARLLPTVGPYSAITSQAVSAGDYEAPRGVNVVYRLRVKWVSPTGAVFTSAWTAASSILSIPATGWVLKSLTDAASVVTGLRVLWETFSESTEVDTGVFEPVDSDETIVIQGRTRGKRLGMELRFATTAEWTPFEALLARKDTMLLQDSNGRQWYVRPSPKARQVEERRYSGVLERRLKMEWIEVAP